MVALLLGICIGILAVACWPLALVIGFLVLLLVD